MNVVADALEAAALEVVRVSRLAPSTPDTDVLRIAVDREAVLLTCDKDVGDLGFRDARSHAGDVLVRLRRRTDQERATRVVALFEEQASRLADAFTVLSNTGVRIRA
ncbi:MAG: DUF5615 family PIN-like protein [Alphaproteobacteria bacterium]|nr:DUF5615 family PIN-like protein [Alphaproteobacteria bacterium]